MKKENKNLELFASFFKIGLFTFGGGLAMLPIMQKEAVEKKHWASEEDVLDMVAISESTPGVLAVNMATFTGYNVGGFWGSFSATLGVVLPSFIVILIISVFYTQFRSNFYIDCAFKGLRAGIACLLVNAALKLGKKIPITPVNLILMAAAFACVFFFNISSILIIALSALFGAVFYSARAGKEGGIK